MGTRGSLPAAGHPFYSKQNQKPEPAREYWQNVLYPLPAHCADAPYNFITEIFRMDPGPYFSFIENSL